MHCKRFCVIKYRIDALRNEIVFGEFTYCSLTLWFKLGDSFAYIFKLIINSSEERLGNGQNSLSLDCCYCPFYFWDTVGF